METNMTAHQLFQPFRLKSLALKNRIVMAPMTRSFSPGGIPTSQVAEYYARRTAGEVGLIVSEGTVVNRPASSNDPDIPHFYGEKPLLGWKAVIDEGACQGRCHGSAALAHGRGCAQEFQLAAARSL
jgi:2,4-dienoyl-CoA reductase-like NADH-dependent reductase (Old Yellow Enzyme family)